MENARRSKSDGGKPETDTHYLGIVIPGYESRDPEIPDVFLNPESGIGKAKSRDFWIEKMCQLKTAYIP